MPEVEATTSTIKIPVEFIDSLSYSDNLESSSFSVNIVDGGMKYIDTFSGKIRLREILIEGTIILITERGQKKFAGRINSVSDSGNVEGDENYKISGGGLETAISEQTIFIDFSDDTKSTLEKTPAVASNFAGKIKAVIKEIAKVVKNAKDPTLLLESLCEAAINQLLSNGSYGGYPFKNLLSYSKTLSKDVYTNNFIHTLQFLNLPQFGNTISFWNMMHSVAKPPLYELFVHYDESSSMYININNSIEKAPENFSESDSNISDPIGTLVFRKTPLAEISSDLELDGFSNKIPVNIINSFSLSSSTNDIFSGVHVGLGILDNMSSLIINPVTYNPELLGRFGQRIFQITLDGVGFPKDATSDGDQAPLKDKITTIQNLIYDVFGKGDRIVSGTLNATYWRGVCKGQYIQIVPLSEFDSLPKRLRRYDPHFYVTGVSVTWSPDSGMADMLLSVKWGRKSDRSEESGL